MTQTAALRKELQSYIADIPEQRLVALRPLLYELSLDTPVIEAASETETRMAEKRIKEWRQDPSCFVPLESVLL